MKPLTSMKCCSKTSFKGGLISVVFFPTYDLMLSIGHFLGIWQHGNEAAIYVDYEWNCHYVQ